MKDIDSIKRTISKYGYTFDQDIYNYWSENNIRLKEKIYGPNVHNDEIDLKIRWESPMGKACKIAIIEHVNISVEETKAENDRICKEQPDLFLRQIRFSKIDFSSFNFSFNNKLYSLSDFAKCFSTSQIRPQDDLRGIDMSSVRLYNCNFINCCFSGSNFSDSYIHQAQLINTDFSNTYFQNADLSSINNDEYSTFHLSNFENAHVHLFYVSDRNLSNIKFTKISYFNLIIFFFKSLYKSNYYVSSDKNMWTNFTVNTNNLSSPSNKEIKDYIDWYQGVISIIYGVKNQSIGKKINVFLEIVATKYWSSYKALGFFSLCLNSLFSLIIYLGHSSFNNLSKVTYLKAFYYSIVTFTTLGYGDIYPIDSLGYVLVIIIVFSGYVTLGLFLFLLSKRIDKSY